MTDTIGSAEGKRRGCAFRNLSNEFIPPYACMMMVAPPDKRKPPANRIDYKATGVRGFGFTIDNEYGIYVDKCDLWGMIMQDPSRFVFNTDVTVPPGGTGYCSFGEYPVRTELIPGMTPYSANLWDACYYGAVANSWQVHATKAENAAFKFFGKVQDRSLMILLAPNYRVPYLYSIGGNFESSGIEVATLTELTQFQAGGLDLFLTQFYDFPLDNAAFTTPITLKCPGVYVFQYRGTASALDPDVSDTAIPYELSIVHDTAVANVDENKGDGVLYKMSNGYSTYWPSQAFEGWCVVRVDSTPVKIQLKQTLTAKVETSGQWRCSYDKRVSASYLADGFMGSTANWWLWGNQ
jgi:hypothetical protein